jgi:hypothetical protein
LSFIVITGTDRKEFEKLRDALEYRTEQSRIYQMDAFGNLNPLGEELVNQLLEYEPIAKPVVETKPTSEAKPAAPEEKVLVNTAAIEKKELGQVIQVVQKKESDHLILRAIIYIVLVGILLFFVVMIIGPFWEQFQNLDKSFLG